MVWIMIIGISISLINVVLTYNELIPFFAAIKQLNHFTTARPSFSNHFFYAFRFIAILPKAAPLLLDLAIGIIAGSIGLSGGVYGALIGLSIGFTASLLVKIHRHFVDPKIKVSSETWKATPEDKYRMKLEKEIDDLSQPYVYTKYRDGIGTFEGIKTLPL
jgi:hypothetical protein